MLERPVLAGVAMAGDNTSNGRGVDHGARADEGCVDQRHFDQRDVVDVTAMRICRSARRFAWPGGRRRSSGTAPVATSAAATPADVPSTDDGKTLFVPVEIAIMGRRASRWRRRGTCRRHRARRPRRTVPSTSAPRRQRCRAETRSVLRRATRSGVQMRVRSTARSARSWASLLSRIRGAPHSAAAMTTRRMIPIFTASGV